MKVFCIKSVLIGIGIGMILTAGFNLLLDNNQKEEVVVAYEQNQQSQLQESISNLKRNFSSNGDTSEESKEEDNKIDDGSTDDAEVNNENTEEEKLEYYTIHVLPGMNSYNIAELLYGVGAIDDIEVFVNYAIIKRVSTRFRAGIKEIPVASDYDEIISILRR